MYYQPFSLGNMRGLLANSFNLKKGAFIMGFARKDVEATKRWEKKFVRYQEGAEKYSLGLTKFQALAKEASKRQIVRLSLN